MQRFFFKHIKNQSNFANQTETTGRKIIPDLENL